MSRAGLPGSRNLSLTEELERLEQSITLTLQEIDHNFSKAHRIVTSSILPLVEQFGDHSNAVWEASKVSWAKKGSGPPSWEFSFEVQANLLVAQFWKQFFEASANVSLAGYEDLANDENTVAKGEEETTVHYDSNTANMTSLESNAMEASGASTTSDEQTPQRRARAPSSGSSRSRSDVDDSTVTTATGAGHQTYDSMLSDGDGAMTGSTPRPPATKDLLEQQQRHQRGVAPQFAHLSSPYETLQREMKREGGNVAAEPDDEDTEVLFQGHTARLPDMSMRRRSSLGGGRRGDHDTGGDEDGYEDDGDGTFDLRPAKKKGTSKDPLLQQVLDKTYRIKATPHRGYMALGSRGVSPIKWRATQLKKEDDTHISWQASPQSSPEMIVPQLRSAVFMSPIRPLVGRARTGTAAAVGGRRTPGVSVQTPGAGTARKTKDVFAEGLSGKGRDKQREEIRWESDSDDDLCGAAGISPPKTIQFALPPSKLLQTPAREASKRIVDDILLTAGEELDVPSEYSPTVVKMSANISDDTF